MQLGDLQTALQRSVSSRVIVDCVAQAFVSKALVTNDTYTRIIKDYYDAEVNRQDFNQPQIVTNYINSWINTRTRGLIPTLLDQSFITRETYSILVSAVYFDGKWKKEFQRRNTRSRCFYSEPDVDCQLTPMMTKTEELFYRFDVSLDAHVLQIPYQRSLTNLTIKNSFIFDNPHLLTKRLILTMFNSGDMVFAKLKGYPYWPAEIKELISDESGKPIKHNVTFFGDGKTAIVKECDLHPYNENTKLTLGKIKTDNFRNKKLNEALFEAEKLYLSRVIYLKHDSTNHVTAYSQAESPNGSIKELENSLVENNYFEDTENEHDKLELAAKIGSALLEENKILKEQNLRTANVSVETVAPNVNQQSQPASNSPSLLNEIVQLKTKQGCMETLIKTMTAQIETVLLNNNKLSELQQTNDLLTDSDKVMLTENSQTCSKKPNTSLTNGNSKKAQTAGNIQTCTKKHKNVWTETSTKEPLKNQGKTFQSISLQVAKAQEKLKKPEISSPVKVAKKPIEKSMMKLSHGPPLHAKLKAEDESYYDFFLKHIDFYRTLKTVNE
ncbi:hypothetical protein J6590_028413 [Homalodisca vitripennis]|nr:hypothetical protein J6590_028413 [Homalodisca vitripennis]